MEIIVLSSEFNSLPLKEQIISSRQAASRVPGPCHSPVFVQVLSGMVLIWCVPCQGTGKQLGNIYDQKSALKVRSWPGILYQLKQSLRVQKMSLFLYHPRKVIVLHLETQKSCGCWLVFFLNAFEISILLKGFIIFCLIAWNKIHCPSNTVIISGYNQGGIIWTNGTLSLFNTLASNVFKK